jgi:hypothetical protein
MPLTTGVQEPVGPGRAARRGNGPGGRLGRLAGLALVALSTCGWAGSVDLPNGGGRVSVPVESMKERQFRGVVKQQYDFSCGSAAVATLLSYHYGREVSELAVFKAMYKHGDQARIRKAGFSMLDMKRYLETQGYRADGFKVPLDKLKKVGVPAIVLTNEDGYSHFVVVKGLADGRVLVGDPAKGMRILPREEFEGMWNGLIFVIRNRMQVARQHFNQDKEWSRLAKAPLETGVRRRGLSDFTLSLPRRGDF